MHAAQDLIMARALLTQALSCFLERNAARPLSLLGVRDRMFEGVDAAMCLKDVNR